MSDGSKPSTLASGRLSSARRIGVPSLNSASTSTGTPASSWRRSQRTEYEPSPAALAMLARCAMGAASRIRVTAATFSITPLSSSGGCAQTLSNRLNSPLSSSRNSIAVRVVSAIQRAMVILGRGRAWRTLASSFIASRPWA
ncbi:hypothetical protein D3C73_1283810 [compost metagenome]